MLDENIYAKIKEISEKAESLFESEQFQSACIKYKEALDLVPFPHKDWEASTWLYAAIGDCYYSLRKYEMGKDNFYEALNCPNGINNPFINLRLGQCLFDLKEFDKSEEYLMKAYMLDGLKIFRGEAEKYLNYLKTKYSL